MQFNVAYNIDIWISYMDNTEKEVWMNEQRNKCTNKQINK